MHRLLSFFSVLAVLFTLSFPFVVFAEEVSYPDVYSTHPVSTALVYLTEKGVVQGYDDGTFRPLSFINRAEFTKMVVEGIFGQTPDAEEYDNCFMDVGEDWYARYVCFAEEQGWVQGYSNGQFYPGDSITRSEAFKILSVAMEWELESDATAFMDIDLTDDEQWYAPYVVMAEERHIIDAFDYYASPHELINRAQMAEILYRGMKFTADESFTTWEIEYQIPRSYQTILDSGIQPAYPSDMFMAHHNQSGWPYGCYTFSVKNLQEWKYSIFMDVAQVQEAIGWDGEYIWTDEEFDEYARLYTTDIIFTYNGSPEFFFKKLAMGEPLILYIPYYLDTDGDGVEENIGHNLVAYSFDSEGVWVADSIYPGSQRRIGYEEVFPLSDYYTQNLTELRFVKGPGVRKGQSGL